MIDGAQIEAATEALKQLFGHLIELRPDTWRDLAAGVIRASEQAAWRPIEEAPRAGYVVLIAKYPNAAGWSDQYQSWWSAGQWVRWPHNFSPTHYRPLPEPPK